MDERLCYNRQRVLHEPPIPSVVAFPHLSDWGAGQTKGPHFIVRPFCLGVFL